MKRKLGRTPTFSRLYKDILTELSTRKQINPVKTNSEKFIFNSQLANRVNPINVS